MFFACIYKIYNYVLTIINNIFTEWDKRFKTFIKQIFCTCFHVENK